MKQTKPLTKILLFLFILVIISLHSKSQDINRVQYCFNNYTQNTFEEKLFVHTDKDVYLPGEILWFKVYGVDGNVHQADQLSKVAYIEILDHHQNAILQTKVVLKNGVGNGSIYLPVSIINGNYQFRAYTRWMKNFSPDFYFEKKITLINPLKEIDLPVAKASTAIDVQFFPEGGSLVSGIESKVAFKAVGENGKGVSISGAITDQKNDTVARFQSLKFGMGSFLFKPLINAVYKAVVQTGHDQIITPLPEIANGGYVMNLTDKGSGHLEITVKSAAVPEGNIYLFAHTRQSIKAVITGLVVNGTAHFTLNANILGEGISHFTIFDGREQPVCERLYFKRPMKRLLIEAGSDKQLYDRRRKVTINVVAKDSEGKSANADMSMAVYRIDSLQHADYLNIFNYLWLNSELKGSIESPDYYFNTASNETDQALDNLMLTQGWRRFQWTNLLAGKAASFAFLPEFNGHIITAKIMNSRTNLPAQNMITYLGVPGKRVELFTSLSDSLGNLSYHTKDFYGSNEIIVQTNYLLDSTYHIDVQSPFSDQNSKTKMPDFKIEPVALTAIQEHSLGAQVQNIYSGDHLKQFYDPLIDSSAFYGKPTTTYKLDDFTRFKTMEEDLREYVKEDNIVKQNGRFHIKVITNKGFLENSDPLVLVDGIPVFNINKVMTIDPLKVKKLEVLAETYFYGPSYAGGIFSFTTYKGDLGGVELDPNAVVLDYEGLQLERIFYSPVYDTGNQAASRMPDFRNLLYWNPSIHTKAVSSFYTSDQVGKYLGVLQGISADGHAGSQYFTFEVK